MAGLKFTISADYGNLKRLKNEIDDLKVKLQNLDRSTDPKGFDKLSKQLQATTKDYNKLGEKIVEQNRKIQQSTNNMLGTNSKLTGMIAKIGGGVGFVELLKNVVNVRGEFQQLDVAFRTLLQSKEKADELMQQMVDTATKTPFTLQDVAGGAKQLIAYGFAANDVNDTLIRLGNIAAGLGLPLERLTYLYGTTMTQGRLYARDLIQFTTSGIPMLQGLADMYGVNTDKINEMVSAGKIGFPEVKKVIENLTNEGGKFYNLMQEQSETITGQISNLKDKLSLMFNEIGKNNEGLIYGSIEGLQTMVEHYDEIGKVLLMLVSVYGSYKAALITTAAIQAAMNFVDNIKLIAMYRKELGLLTATQQAFNLSAKANPYVLLLTVLGTAAAALGIFSKKTSEAASKQKDLDEITKEANARTSEEINKLNSLQKIVKDSSQSYDARKKAITAIQNIVPDYHASLTKEGKLIHDNSSALEVYVNKLKLTARQQIINDRLGKTMEDQSGYISSLSEREKTGILKAQSLKVTSDGGIPKENDRWLASGLSRAAYFAISSNLKMYQDRINLFNSEMDSITKEILSIKPSTDISKNDETEAEKKKRLAAERKAAKTAQEKADADLKIVNETKKAGLEEQQAEIDVQKSILDVQEDGFSKQKQQNDLNHKQRLIDIKKKTQELIEKQQEIERQEWEKGGKKGTFKPTTTTEAQLPESSKNVLAGLRLSDTIITQADSDNLVKQLQQAYESFDEKRRAIDKKYNEDTAAANATLKGSDLETRLKEIDEWRKTQLQQINEDEADSVFKTSDLFIKAFGDMSDKSVSDLRKVISELQTLYNYVNNTSLDQITDQNIGGKTYTSSQLKSIKSSPQSMGNIKSQIGSLTQQEEDVEIGFDRIKTAVKNITQLWTKGGQDGMKSWKKGVQEIQTEFQAFQTLISGITNMLDAMSTEEGDSASSASKSISAVMDVVGSTLQGAQAGAEIGGPIGAAIGGALSFATSTLTKVFEAEKAHEEALRAIKKAKNETQKEYNDLLIEQNSLLKKAETIFGTDAYGQALGYIKQVVAYSSKAKDALSALNSATVATGSNKTGLFGWGGEKTTYSNLLATYPQLIDSQGKLNTELAQSILNNDKLNDSSKKALQTALDYANKYEEALASADEYFSNIFGEIGNDIMKAIDDNLGNAQGALEDFADDAAKTIHKLGLDIAQSLFLADKFAAIKDQLHNIYDDEKLTADQKGDQAKQLIEETLNGLTGEFENIENFMQVWDEESKKSGFEYDSSDSSDSSSSSKGFSSMSQDSADELNGRFTALQMSGVNIENQLAVMSADQKAILDGLTGEFASIDNFLQVRDEESKKSGFEYDSSDSSDSFIPSSGLSSISEDSADGLNGQSAATQMPSVNSGDQLAVISADQKSILNEQIVHSTLLQEQNTWLQESRNIQLQSMYHLENIDKNTNVLPDMSDKLDKIIKNTDNL